jgi:Chitin synthase
MYRLKSLKPDPDGAEKWVPVLLKPEIMQEYSESVVDTLHQKNLLLLGEDRFLSTLMLRNFPHRKMMFCPQAVCKTVIPSSMRVLLSQRRRWINSTLHNLMELVRVRNLCGTFCFSMQFVVLTDLIGTVVLPAAITLTGVLIVKAIMSPPKDFADAIPLLMLALVLGLPGFLILITTRKLVYVFWMMIYLLALPIWNFLLPLYALTKMDDFSWGDTRKVVGDGKKGHGHGEVVDVVGESLASTVPLKRWEDWEKISQQRIKRETARVRELAIAAPSQYGSKFYPAGDDGTLRTNANGRASTAVPPIPPQYLTSTPGRESHLAGVISPPPPSHALDVDEDGYYAPSPAFSSFTLNASQTSLDDYSHHYNPRNGGQSVLLPSLPDNAFTNRAGYTGQGENYPFENNHNGPYPVYGEQNSLTQSAALPGGVDDGQWHPSVINREEENRHRGWFSRWGSRRDNRSQGGYNNGRRPGTSWFDDD